MPEQYLRSFSADHPSSWSQCLAWAELCYSTTYHASLGMTPRKALYGHNPRLMPSHNPRIAITVKVDATLVDRVQLQCSIQERLAQAHA